MPHLLFAIEDLATLVVAVISTTSVCICSGAHLLGRLGFNRSERQKPDWSAQRVRCINNGQDLGKSAVKCNGEILRLPSRSGSIDTVALDGVHVHCEGKIIELIPKQKGLQQFIMEFHQPSEAKAWTEYLAAHAANGSDDDHTRLAELRASIKLQEKVIKSLSQQANELEGRLRNGASTSANDGKGSILSGPQNSPLLSEKVTGKPRALNSVADDKDSSLSLSEKIKSQFAMAPKTKGVTEQLANGQEMRSPARVADRKNVIPQKSVLLDSEKRQGQPARRSSPLQPRTLEPRVVRSTSLQRTDSKVVTSNLQPTIVQVAETSAIQIPVRNIPERPVAVRTIPERQISVPYQPRRTVETYLSPRNPVIRQYSDSRAVMSTGQLSGQSAPDTQVAAAAVFQRFDGSLHTPAGSSKVSNSSNVSSMVSNASRVSGGTAPWVKSLEKRGVLQQTTQPANGTEKSSAAGAGDTKIWTPSSQQRQSTMSKQMKGGQPAVPSSPGRSVRSRDNDRILTPNATTSVPEGPLSNPLSTLTERVLERIDFFARQESSTLSRQSTDETFQWPFPT